MHCLALGVGEHVNGNALFLLCNGKLVGPVQASMPHRLRCAWHEWIEWKRIWRVSVSGPRVFSKAMLNRERASDYPCMKSKACVGRMLTAWLCEKWVAVIDPGNVDHCLVVSVLWCLDNLYNLMEMSPKLMDQESANKFYDLCFTLLRAYHELAARALAARVCLWALKPKLHMLQHLGLEVKLERWNPRAFHGYQDEDMIGRVLRVARRPHA